MKPRKFAQWPWAYHQSKICSVRPGFALVVTLSMMVLLSLLALGLLSLSHTAVRSSAHQRDIIAAQSNARLALQLAIGEIQKTLGPDTRVTASGDILSNGRSIQPSRRHYTGVWNAWQVDPESVGSYAARKSGAVETDDSDPDETIPRGGFHRWLVSSRDPAAASDVGFAEKSDDPDSVVLVREASTASPAMRVPSVPVESTGNAPGQYAWAVLDEGLKARVSGLSPSHQSSSSFAPSEQSSLQGQLAWRNTREWNSLDGLSNIEARRIISQSTAELAGIEEPHRFAHDLTSHASTVMSDVTRGGLKTDLSLLFQRPELPESFSSIHRHIYSDDPLDPIVDGVTRSGHPFSLPSPDPRWELLQQYHRIPQDVFGGDGANARIKFTTEGDAAQRIPFRYSDPANLIPNPDYHHRIKLAPVVSKAQFIFSLAFEAVHKPIQTAWQDDGGKNKSRWKGYALMVIDPVVTLWNPYDVPMDVSKFRLYFYRLPLAFKFENTNTSVFENPTVFTDMSYMVANNANLGSGGDRNPPSTAYPLIISGSRKRDFELQPGEHRVFSLRDPLNSSFLGDGGGDKGLGLQTSLGWSPPTPARNSGGIWSLYLAKTQDQNHAAMYRTADGRMKRTSTIFVGQDPESEPDQIRISVKPTENTAEFYDTLGRNPVDFYVRYGAWVENSQIQQKDEQTGLPDFGAIEFNYDDRIIQELASYQSGQELPIFPLPGQTIPSRTPTGDKRPFLVATLHLKSLVSDEYNSRPAKAWLHNNPTSIYATAGMAGDPQANLGAHQYGFSISPLQGSWEAGYPEVDPFGTRDNGYGGPSPGPKDGRFHTPFTSLPRELPASLAQYRHAPLNQSGSQPLQAQIVANSFAHPLLAQNRVIDRSNSRIDHSYLANRALFDSYYLSTANSNSDFIDRVSGNGEILNHRLRPFLRETVEQFESNNAARDDLHERSAAYFLMDGAFNVNSTSVKAWQVFLSGLNQKQLPYLEALAGGSLQTLENNAGESYSSRYQVPLDVDLGAEYDVSGVRGDSVAWTGYRKLSDQQIQSLAASLVEEIKLRGPFQSLGEFINRRIETGPLGKTGCLQAAIDKSGINEAIEDDVSVEITESMLDDKVSYENNNAALGNSLEGTPGYLTQADLLHNTAPFLTVRSDTFRVRAYGSTLDESGSVRAEAWCEAVVQRVPSYLDPTNVAYDRDQANDPVELTELNRRFGRSFEVISFRWLKKDEISNA